MFILVCARDEEGFSFHCIREGEREKELIEHLSGAGVPFSSLQHQNWFMFCSSSNCV